METGVNQHHQGGYNTAKTCVIQQKPSLAAKEKDEFTPQHDSYELYDAEQLQQFNQEPPYTSPKNNSKINKYGESMDSEEREEEEMKESNGIVESNDQQFDDNNDDNHYKDEPLLMDFCATNDQPLDPLFRNHMRPFINSGKDTQNMAGEIYDNSSAVRMTQQAQQLPVLDEDLDNDLLYLDRENSGQNRPQLSGQLTNLMHADEMLVNAIAGGLGKHSDGTQTARKPKLAGVGVGGSKRGGATRENYHRLASATCRYSSWERAYSNVNGEEGDSLDDSLSRLFNQNISCESDEGQQILIDKEENQAAASIHTDNDLSEFIKQTRLEADKLKNLALSSCSTTETIIQISDQSSKLANSINAIEQIIRQQKSKQGEIDLNQMEEKTKSKLKKILRTHNIGIDAKQFQKQASLQKEIHILIGAVNELQDRNVKNIDRQRKRLQNYEKELYQLLQAIQEFQVKQNGGNLNSGNNNNNNSKLGRISAFTGYNGMKFGDEVKAAPSMNRAAKNNNQSAVISAYGSQGLMMRDNSQLLNLTPLQGMTSALTNSNFKLNNAFVNSNSSSGEKLIIKDDQGYKKSANNILIADQSDNSIIGQLKQQTNFTNISGEHNVMNNAMIASLTQRSYNLAMENTVQNDTQSHLASQRKPQTARCGSAVNKMTHVHIRNEKSNAKGLSHLLDYLHEKLRSLTERIHEVITTKLKPQREKSYQAFSSIKSQMRYFNDDKKSRRGGRQGSDSRHKSIRGSSKSRRMMRFKRFKSNQRDHTSIEPRNGREKAPCRQRSSLYDKYSAPNESSNERQNSESQSPIGSAHINPFNRAFIKSHYRSGLGGAANLFNQQDTISQQYSGENSQLIFTGTNTYFHFGGPSGIEQQQNSNLFPMCQTQAVLARQKTHLAKIDQKNLNKFINEQAQGGFHSARNEFDIRKYLTKPSETVPATQKVSRLTSGIGSANRSFDNDMSPKKIRENELFKNQGALMFDNSLPVGATSLIQTLNQQSPINLQNQPLNLSKLSERRQEFSATFNNQLSSVRRDRESSGESKSADALIPNFYPQQQQVETTPFDGKEFSDLAAKELKPNTVNVHRAKKASKKIVSGKKNARGSTKGKFETEDAPKIPKLNLGKIKADTKHEYFTKNISDYDDTSIGDYEMILRNQKFGINSSKDPSILTASKSQFNQSIGSYQSRLQHRSRIKERQNRLTSSKNNYSKKLHRATQNANLGGKQYAAMAHHRVGGGFSKSYNQMNGPSPKNRPMTNRLKSHGSKGKKKKNSAINNHINNGGLGSDSSDMKVLQAKQNSQQLALQNLMLQSSEGNSISAAKILLKNMTGVSGYINHHRMENNKVQHQPVSHREEKIGTATTMFVLPTGVDHQGGDLYMSFIDSDKFSPIQSVSGEENDEDDSLDHQKAKILFDDTALNSTELPPKISTKILQQQQLTNNPPAKTILETTPPPQQSLMTNSDGEDSKEEIVVERQNQQQSISSHRDDQYSSNSRNKYGENLEENSEWQKQQLQTSNCSLRRDSDDFASSFEQLLSQFEDQDKKQLQQQQLQQTTTPQEMQRTLQELNLSSENDQLHQQTTPKHPQQNLEEQDSASDDNHDISEINRKTDQQSNKKIQLNQQRKSSSNNKQPQYQLQLHQQMHKENIQTKKSKKGTTKEDCRSQPQMQPLKSQYLQQRTPKSNSKATHRSKSSSKSPSKGGGNYQYLRNSHANTNTNISKGKPNRNPVTSQQQQRLATCGTSARKGGANSNSLQSSSQPTRLNNLICSVCKQQLRPDLNRKNQEEREKLKANNSLNQG